MTPGESAELDGSSRYFSDESASSMPTSASSIESESQMNYLNSEDLKQDALEIVDTTLTSNDVTGTASELFVMLTIATFVLGGLTFYYLYRFLKKI